MAGNQPQRNGGRREEVSGGAHRRHTEARLVLGGFAILLTVGGLLIAVLLGTGPAAVAVGVLLLATGLLLALYTGMGLLESWLKR